MAEYQKPTERFFFTGLSVLPPDALPEGKYPYVLNVRSYADGRFQPRAGLGAVATSLGSAIHTLARLNDSTTFNGGVPAVRLYGAGGSVYRGTPGGAPALLDAGYSGDPLTTFSGQPPQSPRPWAYLADSAQYRKCTTDSIAYDVGIAQSGPLELIPTLAVGRLERNGEDIISAATWSGAGTVASAPTAFNRIDTTISQILYDDPATNTGYCSIVPADAVNITTGTMLTVGDPSGFFEIEIITDVTIAVSPTTVEAIIYDAGNTGLCTVQPAGSLGTGQLEAPPIDAYRRRAFNQQGTAYAVPRGQAGNLPVLSSVTNNGADVSTLPTRTIRQVDFPVDSLIQIGSEVVRILSVAVGSDGVQSFRCETATTISPGDTITGVPAFRIWLPSTHVAGERLIRPALQNTLTYGAPTTGNKAAMTGGIAGTWTVDLAKFGTGKAVLPDDEVHIAVNIDRLTEALSVRLYIDVDATTNDFLQNYYFHEWRASDIIASIQATNAAEVAPLIVSRQTVVANQQLETTTTAAPRGSTTVSASDIPQGTAQQANNRRPTAQTATSTQLGLGNSQWIDLRVKIGTLQRVGTDPTRTLADAKAFEILVSCEALQKDVTPSPITVSYSDLQIYGGSGPDVGEVGDPYVYTYRYRSSITGAVSNPAPANRHGVVPRRQAVACTAPISADPQVDKVDWFRLGGSLTQWTYVGTGSNDGTAFDDTFLDAAIDGGEVLRFDLFQPWPLQDDPRVGTCNVSGTAIEWVSGDTFNTAWAPGSIILVNGRATTLYAAPSSSTLLHVVDNVGSGSAVPFSLTGPTLMSQPLASAWGDYQGFYFACGDAINPGTLYWSHGNNVEATSDANSLIVTTPSEPLMAGGVYNAFPFVFSSDHLYTLILTAGGVSPVRALRTPCGRGLWTRWAWCIGTEGIFFLSGDGIYVTAGGSAAQCLTPDLRSIFPHDGVPGVDTNGIPAPDMTQTTRLRLSYIGGYLYFDYLDLQGTPQTLMCDLTLIRWYHDNSALTGLTVRLEEPGAGVYDQIVGGADGVTYQYDGSAITDAGTNLSYAVWTRYVDGGRPRVVKQFGDISVDLDLAGNAAGIGLTPVTDDGQTISPTKVLGAGDTGRQTYLADLVGGAGLLTRNLGIRLTGTLQTGDTDRPSLYWWEPSFLFKAEDIARRATDWSDEGYVGAKFVQGVIIRANTYGATKLVQVQKDGGVVALTLSLNHDGETQVAYPLASAGWTPFVTELVRLVGADDVDWQLLEARFIYEPAPELATQWETQFTSHDFPGYQTVRDMVVGYEATEPFTLTMTCDDRIIVQTLPSTGGVYKRTYLPICPNKEKAVKYQWTTTAPGRLYKKDLAVRVQPWGFPGGYRVVNPFGGPSRADGAAI